MKAEPFEIAVPEADVEDMRRRLGETRWADDFGNADWRYGVERDWLHDMCRYWREDYDWRETERAINSQPNFRVEIDGVPLHFQHIRGKGPSPVPLLLMHGWPWTFFDFHELIGPLTDPAAHGGKAEDAFDLIIPSLPGFGFSVPLRTAGIDTQRHAELFVKLVCEVLGYDRFAAAGGDWGATISAQLGHAFPERVLGIFTSIPFFPGLDLASMTPESYAPDEQWMLARTAEAAPHSISHFTVNIHDPQTLAYGLVDSPVGTAAWIWERRRSWSDCNGDLLTVFDRDSLCSFASILWLTRSIGTSLRIYWEQFRSGMPVRPVNDRKPVVSVPAGFAIFPKEAVLIPRAVAESGINVQHWEVMPKGGHFGFAEQPGPSVAAMTTFFRRLRS